MITTAVDAFAAAVTEVIAVVIAAVVAALGQSS